MSKPKILLLDIETAPAVAYIWRMFDETVGLEQLIDPGRVICAAWQWYGEKEVHFGAEWESVVEEVDLDSRTVTITPTREWMRDLHAAMCEADAIITYNGDKFDLPKLNGEFVQLGLPPPTPAASIDLRKVVKKMGWVSGKLAFVGPHLKIGAKVKHEGFELWKKVLAGDEKAQSKMERYNKQDTRLLSKLYKKLRPYIKNHPHLHEDAKEHCPSCGSHKVQRRGYRYTKSFKIERLQCTACGSWHDGKKKKLEASPKNGR